MRSTGEQVGLPTTTQTSPTVVTAPSGVRTSPTSRASEPTHEATETTAAPGLLANRYRMSRWLGRGGMGEVWFAEDTDTRRTVAVKVGCLRDRRDPAVEKACRARFLFEASVAARVASFTPRVPAVHALLEDEGKHYLVMEVIDGNTLKTEISERGALHPRRVAEVVREVSLALQDVHIAGYAHCDVKPGNIILVPTVDGRVEVKLIDFGCAQAIEPSPETPAAPPTKLRFGSMAYMSPEQLLAGNLDERTDVWGLGVLAYEALTGARPFVVEAGGNLTMHILTQPYVPVSKRVRSLPRALDAWFWRALAKKPDARFQTVAEAAEAFAAAVRTASAEPQDAFSKQQAG
ncbi:MAG: serine/threonine-protein kinase [Polyangiaceae bacterium]